jgi:hypothetical protein
MQVPHNRIRKRNIVLIIVIIVFCGSYARHRYLSHEIIITGRLQDRAMDETSGIAASGIFKDMYYIHNDSGDTSRFFMISPDGKLQHTIYYKNTNTYIDEFDCEDIAVGPGPAKQKSYIYIANIGDNGHERPSVTIYRFEEQPSWQKDSVVYANTAKLFLKYPDGPADAETLMIDPVEKLLCIVSKREDSVKVYTTPLNYKDNDTVTLTLRCKLFFEGAKPFKWITAGDISRDGKQILLKNYQNVYYWKRSHDEHIWQTMQKTPEILPYQVEKQGEAIGFTADGKGYFTTSEGVFAPIYYYNSP